MNITIVNTDFEDNGFDLNAELTAEWLIQQSGYYFDPELPAERFMNGGYSDTVLSLFTGEQCDLIYDEILARWGEEQAERFDTKVLPLISE